ncbi:MAG: peroxiredoxin [Thermoplasmata archaeon]
MVLKIGDEAEDFSLPDQNLKMKRLSDFYGKNILLAFFPGAFTSVCTKEMCTFRDSIAKFNKFNAKVFGISVDPPFSLNAFAKYNNLNFDLLSDFNKEVCNTYAGLHEDFAGIKGLKASKRAVFIIGKDKKIKYVWISEDPGKEPDYNEIENTLMKL